MIFIGSKVLRKQAKYRPYGASLPMQACTHYLHERGKTPVANVATARRLADWIRAIGRMSEGTLWIIVRFA